MLDEQTTGTNSENYSETKIEAIAPDTAREQSGRKMFEALETVVAEFLVRDGKACNFCGWGTMFDRPVHPLTCRIAKYESILAAGREAGWADGK